jgi:Xaa-Pro aminopeptidase
LQGSSDFGHSADFVSYNSYARLTDRLPKLRILSAKDFFEAARTIKTPGEIEALCSVGRAAHEAHHRLLLLERQWRPALLRCRDWDELPNHEPRNRDLPRRPRGPLMVVGDWLADVRTAGN